MGVEFVNAVDKIVDKLREVADALDKARDTTDDESSVRAFYLGMAMGGMLAAQTAITSIVNSKSWS